MNRLLALILILFPVIAQAQLPVVTKITFPTYNKYINNSLRVLKNKLYFLASDIYQRPVLWESDGTQAGTRLVYNMIPGNIFEADLAGNMAVLDSTLFFYTMQNVNNTSTQFIDKLWKSDGTTTGTVELARMSFYSSFAYKGKLYFNGTTTTGGSDLWESDGTSAGTKPIIYNGTYASMIDTINGLLVFKATDLAHGTELWVTDGTAAGTKLLKDIYPGTNSNNIFHTARLGNRLFFNARDTSYNYEMWVTDGTDTGTKCFMELVPGKLGGGPGGMYVHSGKMYFYAGDTMANALYVTDGTDTGTHLITHIGGKNCACSPPQNFCWYKNKIYFAGDNADSINIEFWVTDGTDTGTMLVKDIYPNNRSSYPRNITTYKNHMLFGADVNGVGGSRLMLSDGTPNGTIELSSADIQEPFILFDNNLYTGTEYFLLRIEDTTGKSAITQINNQPTFTLYPNPNGGTFTIEIPAAFKTAGIKVYDMMGRLVHTEALRTNTTTIKLNAPAGTYIMKLHADDAVMTKRVVVD